MGTEGKKFDGGSMGDGIRMFISRSLPHYDAAIHEQLTAYALGKDVPSTPEYEAAMHDPVVDATIDAIVEAMISNLNDFTTKISMRCIHEDEQAGALIRNILSDLTEEERRHINDYAQSTLHMLPVPHVTEVESLRAQRTDVNDVILYLSHEMSEFDFQAKYGDFFDADQ